MLHGGGNVEAGLGIAYEKCVGEPDPSSPPPIGPKTPQNDKKQLSRRTSERWAMLREAGRLLPEERVYSCSRNLVDSATEVSILASAEGGKAFFGNLKRCGSVWQCPVCAAKITEHRRTELQEGLKNWADRGGQIFLLTLTVPHHASSDVRLLCDQLLRALKLMQNRSHYRAVRLAIGLRGTVRALEVTYGKNGAHVHLHILLFCDGKRKPEKADFLGAWQSACEAAGLPEPNEHGVDLRDGTYAAAYVGKWGLDCEMTKAHVKKGNGSGRTPWDLLRASMQGEELAGELFKVHVEAFFRRRQLVWSKGLRLLLGLAKEKSDEEIAEEPEQQLIEVTSVGIADWALVLKYEARGALLIAAEHGGAGGVEAFLFGLRNRAREDWRVRHWRN